MTSEKELKTYLQNLSKDQLINLYLQKRFDQEFIKLELLSSIYNQLIDCAHYQLNIFDSWDMIIPQDKFRAIFSKGGINEDTSNTE